VAGVFGQVPSVCGLHIQGFNLEPYLRFSCIYLKGVTRMEKEKIKVERSGTKNNGMNQENKATKKRKIKDNMYNGPKYLDTCLIFKAY
jgi:hypothetical protein